MMIPVRCISCGNPIGHLWETFQKRVASGEDPKKVLDELGLTRYCCRTLFLTHLDMVKQIAKYKV